MTARLAHGRSNVLSCGMAEIAISEPDEEFSARLRELAAVAGRTVEQESREILTVACADQPLVGAGLRQCHADYRGHLLLESADLVREMRDWRTG